MAERMAKGNGVSGIVVIGAGQAGASLVARLRAEGHGGEITLIGAEPVPPYQRPPLSKGYLLGELPVERLFLRPTSFYDEHGIVLKLGTEAVAVDRAARQVALADGERLAYDQLVLTTGSRPRRLPEAPRSRPVASRSVASGASLPGSITRE